MRRGEFDFRTVPSSPPPSLPLKPKHLDSGSFVPVLRQKVREKQLLPLYTSVATTFADLHDRAGRMKAKIRSASSLIAEDLRSFSRPKKPQNPKPHSDPNSKHEALTNIPLEREGQERHPRQHLVEGLQALLLLARDVGCR